MTRSDLFKVTLLEEQEELHLLLEFSNVAKWSAKVLHVEKVTLGEFLATAEAILAYKNKAAQTIVLDDSNPIKIEFTKTGAKIICNDYYVPVRLKDLYYIFISEVEKLFLMGVINLN